MKRIGFIAPVEFMSGNLSGNQELAYRPNNNKAWNAPSDSRSYANNYQARYVGMRRTKDGRVFFGVRTKNAINMTDKSRLNMAALAVSNVIANYIKADLSTLAQLQNYYSKSGYIQQGWTFKRWLMYYIRTGLVSKNHIFFNSPGESSIIYRNPYLSNTIPGAIEINNFPQDLLVKFWMQLANNPLMFTIGAYTGIAHTGWTWNQLIESDINILSLVAVTLATSGTYVCASGSTPEHGEQLSYNYGVIRNNVAVTEQISETIAPDPQKSPLFFYEY